MTLLSTKPYLIRAIHEWCLDQGFTPYLQVTADSRCQVPRGHVKDGQIVLNVGTAATNQMVLGNEEIQFQARFNGAVFSILVPIDAVAAIYARENGHGMAFDVTSVTTGGKTPTAGAAPDRTAEPGAQPGGRPHLTRIK